MTIRADTNSRFFIRFGLIAVVGLGFSLLCLKDGFFTYPNQRARALRYAEHFEQQLNDQDRSEQENAQKVQEWNAIADENGWPREYPGLPKSEVDIKMQFAMAAVSGAVGLGFLIVVLRGLGRWIAADDEQITTSWGQVVPFDSILHVKKKAWQSKGLATVVYQADGRKRKFVVDDLKFHREPTDAIMRRIESKLTLDQIIGGPPEPTEEELAATAEQYAVEAAEQPVKE